MKYKKIVLCLLAAPYLLIHVAHATFNAAGILPYAYDKYGTAFVLLGQERYSKTFKDSKTWADFGGGKKRQDKFHPSWTAARECEEETIGLIGSYKKLLNQLKDYKQSKTYRINNTQDDYVMYLAPVDYQHTLPQRFKQKRFQDKNLTSDQKEKVDLAWTSVRTIMKTLEKAESSKNIRTTSTTGASLLLRQPFVRTLSIAHEKGILDNIARKQPGNASIDSKPYITYHTNRLSKKLEPTMGQKVAHWYKQKRQVKKQKSLQAEPKKHKQAPQARRGWWLWDSK